MKILVTGAAGFLGSHVARHLHSSGHSVLGVDSYDTATSVVLKEERVRQLLTPLGIQVIRFDLADYSTAHSLFADFIPEVVIHLAARPGVRSSASATPAYIHSNLVAYSNVWTLSHLHGVRLFLYASSSSVYGRAGRPGIVLSEDLTKPVPINLYGATKLANEAIATSELPSSNLRTLGLRFFTLYGPWGRPDMLPLRAMEALRTRQTLPIFGDGSAMRGFTFVEDAVGIVERLMQHSLDQPRPVANVVNVADGSTTTILDFLQLIQSASGLEFSFEWNPALDVEMAGTQGSNKKLHSLIGETSWTPLRDGLKRTWEWLVSADLPSNWNKVEN